MSSLIIFFCVLRILASQNSSKHKNQIKAVIAVIGIIILKCLLKLYMIVDNIYLHNKHKSIQGHEMN